MANSYRVPIHSCAASQGPLYFNNLRFPTRSDAEDYGKLLARRWHVVASYEVVPSPEPANCRFPVPSDRYPLPEAQRPRPPAHLLIELLKTVIERTIRLAVEYAQGDKQAAARLLGIGKTTVYRKMAVYEKQQAQHPAALK